MIKRRITAYTLSRVVPIFNSQRRLQVVLDIGGSHAEQVKITLKGLLCKVISEILLYIKYCHVFAVLLSTRYGLANGFVDHLHTPLGTTSNYSVIADLQTLQITTTPAKAFPGNGF
jgi:hypothetical protein